MGKVEAINRVIQIKNHLDVTQPAKIRAINRIIEIRENFGILWSKLGYLVSKTYILAILSD